MTERKKEKRRARRVSKRWTLKKKEKHPGQFWSTEKGSDWEAAPNHRIGESRPCRPQSHQYKRMDEEGDAAVASLRWAGVRRKKGRGRLVEGKRHRVSRGRNDDRDLI